MPHLRARHSCHAAKLLLKNVRRGHKRATSPWVAASPFGAEVGAVPYSFVLQIGSCVSQIVVCLEDATSATSRLAICGFH